MNKIIEIKNLYKTFITEAGQSVHALEDININIYEHDFVCIIGPSGSGKSTLLRLMEGLIFPTKGSIKVAGSPVTGSLSQAGMVFQEYSLIIDKQSGNMSRGKFKTK